MKIFTNLLAVLAILAGVIASFSAFATPSILSGARNPSAIQITQVYSEATFYGILAVASFLFAVCVLLGNVISAINEQTEVIQYQTQVQKK